jgi:hypothetical protein
MPKQSRYFNLSCPVIIFNVIQGAGSSKKRQADDQATGDPSKKPKGSFSSPQSGFR